jgi:hypothetical protein
MCPSLFVDASLVLDTMVDYVFKPTWHLSDDGSDSGATQVTLNKLQTSPFFAAFSLRLRTLYTFISYLKLLFNNLKSIFCSRFVLKLRNL